MELKYSGLSPFVRKVLVVAHEAGVADRIELTPVKARDEPETVVPFNPLGKIPALVLDDGSVLYDSPVICEYLDTQFGGNRLLPRDGPRRYRILTRAALADGIMDAAILLRSERVRPPEKQVQDAIDWQLGKVMRGFDTLEYQVDSFGDELDLGLVAAGCACGYVPLRIAEAKDLARWPRLARWYADVSKRASFARTTPVL